jgi:hypothetical protein
MKIHRDRTMAFAYAIASCAAAEVVLHFTLLPQRVPLLLGEVWLPVLLQQCWCFLERLLCPVRSATDIVDILSNILIVIVICLKRGGRDRSIFATILPSFTSSPRVVRCTAMPLRRSA